MTSIIKKFRSKNPKVAKKSTVQPRSREDTLIGLQNPYKISDSNPFLESGSSEIITPGIQNLNVSSNTDANSWHKRIEKMNYEPPSPSVGFFPNEHNKSPSEKDLNFFLDEIWQNWDAKICSGASISDEHSQFLKLYRDKAYLKFQTWKRETVENHCSSYKDFIVVHSEKDEATANSLIAKLKEKNLIGQSFNEISEGDNIIQFLEKLHEETEIVFILITDNFQNTDGLHAFFTQQSLHSLTCVVPILPDYSNYCRLKNDPILGNITRLYLNERELYEKISNFIEIKCGEKRRTKQINESIHLKINDIEEKFVGKVQDLIRTHLSQETIDLTELHQEECKLESILENLQTHVNWSQDRYDVGSAMMYGT